jgi:hypothetical protein
MTSATVRGEWWALRLGRFTLDTQWIRGCLGPRIGLDYMEIRRMFLRPGLEIWPICHPALQVSNEWLVLVVDFVEKLCVCRTKYTGPIQLCSSVSDCFTRRGTSTFPWRILCLDTMLRISHVSRCVFHGYFSSFPPILLWHNCRIELSAVICGKPCTRKFLNWYDCFFMSIITL